jgi:hypothetical protein
VRLCVDDGLLQRIRAQGTRRTWGRRPVGTVAVVVWRARGDWRDVRAQVALSARGEAPWHALGRLGQVGLGPGGNVSGWTAPVGRAPFNTEVGRTVQWSGPVKPFPNIANGFKFSNLKNTNHYLPNVQNFPNLSWCYITSNGTSFIFGPTSKYLWRLNYNF